MKKFLLPVLILLVFCANAQEKFSPQTYIGINGGASFSQMYFYPSVSMVPLQGYQGGLVFKYISEPHLGIQLELNYAQRGWEENLTWPYMYQQRLNYLEVPFMSHFELGKRVKFFFNVGPVFSYLLSNSGTVKFDKNVSFPDYYGRDKDIFGYNISPAEKTYLDDYGYSIDKRVELGVCGGLGFSVVTPIGDFQFEGRFHQGINNLFKDATDFVYSTHQVLSGRVSYLFPIR